MEPRNKKLAGYFEQCLIVTWKNLLIYKEQKLGIIFEFIYPLLFVGLAWLLLSTVVLPSPGLGDSSSFTERYYESYPANLYYYPDNQVIGELMSRAFRDNNVNLIAVNTTTPRLDGKVMFVSFPSQYDSWQAINSSVIEYTIYSTENFKTDENFVPKSSYMYTSSLNNECYNLKNYIDYTTFNQVKKGIDQSIIETLAGREIHYPRILFKRFECPKYLSQSDDLFKSSISFLFPSLISLSVLVSFLLNVSNIIEEKQARVKEYLKIIGGKSSVLTICWIFKSYLIYLVLVASLFTYILKKAYQSNREWNEYLPDNCASVIFLTIHTFALQVNCLSILVGQVFSKQFAAKTVSIFVWLATLINVFNYFVYPLKHLLAVFPNIALAFCFETIYQYARSAKKLDLSNIFSSFFEDDVSVGFLLLSMHLWSVFYLTLGWYLEKVFPGEYGVKHPWYFLFIKSYWKGSLKRLGRNRDEEDNMLLEEKTLRDAGYFEQDPASLRATVKLKNLTKTFRVGFENKVAVNKLSLNFYENQITGFLGHNGAGKTTVTFMLCGLYSPTSGTAEILDEDIRVSLNRVRTQIGFCPQTNILFDQLTVEQHLKLVCLIKGFTCGESKEEIDKIAKYVGLHTDLHKKASQLSGGMKRRLSVAMAFIGDSKVIILDEPTSGLDPYNRRTLWELIKNYKQDKTILLTTHYMDEADALSDRIAIMSHGELRCCGSPLFLKSKFGTGYSLTFNKDPAVFNLEATGSLIKQCLNGIELKCQSDVAREICYSVPTSLSGRMSDLLNAIEQNKSRLGILSYGISSSTVEDVYIKVQADGSDEKLLHQMDLCKPIFNPSNNEKVTGICLLAQRILSQLRKRSIMLSRRYLILAFTFLLPILIISGAYFIPSSSSMFKSALSVILDNLKTNLGSINLNVEFYGQNSLRVPISVNRDDDEFKRLDEMLRQNFMNRKFNQVKFEKIDHDVKERMKSADTLMKDYIIGFSFYFGDNHELDRATVYYSTLAYHSNGVVLNELNSILLSYYTNTSRRFKVTNAPWIQALDPKQDNDVDFTFTDCFESIPFSILDSLIGFVVAFLISLACIHVTRERVNKSKQLQIMQGGGWLVYWASNYLFEFLLYSISIVLMIALITILGNVSSNVRNDYTLLAARNENLLKLFGFLLVTSFSWSTLAYVWSFMFKSEMVAFVTLFIVLTTASFIDMVLALVYFFMLSFSKDYAKKESQTKQQIIGYRTFVSGLFPNVAAKRAVYNLKTNGDEHCTAAVNTFKDLFKNEEIHINLDILPLLITNLVALSVLTIVLIIIENKFLLKLLRDWTFRLFDLMLRKSRRESIVDLEQLEEDVRKEKERVEVLYENSEQKALETVMVRNVTKKYKKNHKKWFYAVDHLSFGVGGAECFGLLGLNGAGKTSTLRILIGETSSTSGQTSLNGVNARLGRRIPDLGYCPQFDYLPVFLSVKQCLDLFANLKGLEKESREFIIEKILVNFKLDEFKNTLVQNLSGGNKRKVSSALAFLGCPKTVILDEPTAGMDPVSKRCLWNFIKSARDNGITVLLTTHNMEECEALCTKLGILVNGQFRCFGNIQHLKSKYGQGYTLILKCKHETSSSPSGDAILSQTVEKLERFVKENIPDSVLTEKQEQTLFFQIQFSTGQNLARLFTLIEDNKDLLSIETYSLTQTTLEQIFISFARAQVQSDEDEKNQT